MPSLLSIQTAPSAVLFTLSAQPHLYSQIALYLETIRRIIPCSVAHRCIANNAMRLARFILTSYYARNEHLIAFNRGVRHTYSSTQNPTTFILQAVGTFQEFQRASCQVSCEQSLRLETDSVRTDESVLKCNYSTFYVPRTSFAKA